MSTLDQLQEILHRDYAIAREALRPDTTLETLGLDSLSVLELMFKIEDGFGVKITEDTPTDLVTVGDIVRYVDGLLTHSAAGKSHRTVGVAGAP